MDQDKWNFREDRDTAMRRGTEVRIGAIRGYSDFFFSSDFYLEIQYLQIVAYLEILYLQIAFPQNFCFSYLGKVKKYGVPSYSINSTVTI